ncbi:MAG: hypothetical protein FJ253_02885 [Phycisphaerae bacterium]|nr:hypothetical protein [Phycisphaerae bacterium]
MSGFIPRVRPVKGAASGPSRRCTRCGYLLFEGQSICPECGFELVVASGRSRREVPQLYTQGPAVVKPIALRFVAMGATALLGPMLALVLAAVLPLAGVTRVPDLGDIVALLAAPLPISMALALPYGWGSLGAPDSPIPIAWPRIGRHSLHLVTLALAPSWWLVSILLWTEPAHPLAKTLLVGAVIAASAGTYLHLSWLAALGDSVADEGPTRVYTWCVGIGVLSAILSFVVTLFQGTWTPVVLGMAAAFVSALAAQILAPALLARDMLLTLIGSYEEVGRSERRARRAAEHEPRLPR